MSTEHDNILGMPIQPFPPGLMPIDAIIIVKWLDDEGSVQWSSRFTENISTPEAMGLLATQQQVLLNQMVNFWQSSTGNGDEES